MRQVAFESLDLQFLIPITIDASDEDIDFSVSPGNFLLDKEATYAIANRYRGNSSTEIVKYLMDNGVLDNKLIWLKGLASKHVKRWFDFIQPEFPGFCYTYTA
jgi:hypothetical protein